MLLKVQMLKNIAINFKDVHEGIKIAIKINLMYMINW